MNPTLLTDSRALLRVVAARRLTGARRQHAGAAIASDDGADAGAA